MTPSQEAKEYAALYGFTLKTYGKRVGVEPTEDGDTFSGYPAALNYMRRIVSEKAAIDEAIVRNIEAMPYGKRMFDVETLQARSVFEAVDKRVLEAFAKAESALSDFSQAVGTIQFPCVVGAKRWRKIKRAQRKADRLRMCRICRYDQITSRRAWRVFADHQLQASCDSRKEAIAYVRSELAGQRGVTVQYV